jgi:radical SAM superfamily enzyme YgiQ (UPF0313 family)
MKFVLVTPPHYFLFSGAGIPRLAGFIKSKGHEVIQLDIDELIYSDLLTGESLTKIFSRIESLESQLLLDSGGRKIKEMINGLRPEIQKRLALPHDPEVFLKTILSARDQLSWEIHDSLQSFKTMNLNGGRADFIHRLQLAKLAVGLFSLAYGPVSWGLLEGFQFRFSPTRVQDILCAIANENENPLISYFSDKILALILSHKPDAIGISLNHFSQFIPGLTLCRLLKERCSLPIILGGETLTQVARFLPAHPGLFHLFDYVALGKGEYTLEGLTTPIAATPEKIPNLAYVQKGKLYFSKIREEVNLDTLPSPQCCVQRPNPIIALSLSSGCGWGKCAFCFYPFTQTQGQYRKHAVYQQRSLARVIEDIKKIHQDVSPSLFYFTDHSIPFSRLKEIGEGMRMAGISVPFFSFIRAEEEFASLDNLVRLRELGFIGGYFGLESANQRINDLMNKGIIVENIERILRGFSKAGLISSLFAMIGFPGETTQEATRTIEFLKNMKHLISGDLSLGNFHLKCHTPVFKDPARYGITRHWASENEDFPLRYHYEVKEGLSEADTLQLLKNAYRQMNLKYLSSRLVEEVVFRLSGK